MAPCHKHPTYESILWRYLMDSASLYVCIHHMSGYGPCHAAKLLLGTCLFYQKASNPRQINGTPVKLDWRLSYSYHSTFRNPSMREFPEHWNQSCLLANLSLMPLCFLNCHGIVNQNSTWSTVEGFSKANKQLPKEAHCQLEAPLISPWMKKWFESFEFNSGGDATEWLSLNFWFSCTNSCPTIHYKHEQLTLNKDIRSSRGYVSVKIDS